MRSINRAIAILPAYQLGDLRVPGPDEDTFTLAIAALEGLARSATPPSRLYLIGEFSPVADWGFQSYLDSEGLVLERYPSGSEGLFRALVAAAQTTSDPAPTVVVAAEVATPTQDLILPSFGGGALAFHLAEGAGILPLETTNVPLGSASSDSDQATLRLMDSIPASPGRASSNQEDASRALPGWGNAPTLGPGLGIHRLGRKLANGATGGLEDRTTRSTNRLTLQRDGEVAWLGAFGEIPGAGVMVTDDVWRRSFDRPTHSVSEGAYVPRARYIENLPSRWKFEASRCSACGAYALPPRTICPRCYDAHGMVPEGLPRDGGTIVASTTIGPGGQPTEFDSQVELTGGYQVVLVELAPGIRVTLQVSDAPPGRLEIGDQVGSRLRRLYAMEGEWRYGRKAVPFDSRSDAGTQPSLERWAPPQ
ncbi:MAG: zinc ribbon domain-containing protein [Thermoplasmata archaeon]